MSGLLGQLGLAALMKGMGGGGGSRRRSYRAPAKKYARTIKRMKRSAPYVMSRKYPGSKFGYSATPRTAETLANYGETWRKATAEQKAARTAQRYFGRGLYTRGHTGCANNLLADGLDTKPSFQNIDDEMGAIMITHHEYIKDIYGAATSSFSNEEFNVNPGLEATFPWLAQVAANFEEYEFIQCVFEYRSTLGDSAQTTNGQVGQIMMAPNYNVGQPIWTDKLNMLSSPSPISGKTTQSITSGIECKHSVNAGSRIKYVRTSPVFVDEDIKTYDLAKFQVAQLGIPTEFYEQQMGELWVQYSVILRKPKLNTGVGNTISTDEFCANISGGYQLWTGQQNSIGTSFSQDGSTYTITFPSSACAYYEITSQVSFVSPDTYEGPPGITLTGEVELVSDLMLQNGAVNYMMAPDFSGTSTVTAVTTVLHVRVNTGTGGLSNTVQIDYDSLTLGRVIVTVKEYNTMNGVGSLPIFLKNGAQSIPFD